MVYSSNKYCIRKSCVSCPHGVWRRRYEWLMVCKDSQCQSIVFYVHCYSKQIFISYVRIFLRIRPPHKLVLRNEFWAMTYDQQSGKHAPSITHQLSWLHIISHFPTLVKLHRRVNWNWWNCDTKHSINLFITHRIYRIAHHTIVKHIQSCIYHIRLVITDKMNTDWNI